MQNIFEKLKAAGCRVSLANQELTVEWYSKRTNSPVISKFSTKNRKVLEERINKFLKEK